MFLYGEGARIKIDAEDFNIWDESSPSPADGKDQQLSDNLYSWFRYSLSVHEYIEAYTSDGHRGIAEEKELVQALVREMRMRVYSQLQIPDQRTGIMIAHTKPSTQERSVDTGISGSSVLATAERTSGYGESSSGSQCKPNMDLREKYVPKTPAIAASLSILGSSKSGKAIASRSAVEFDVSVGYGGRQALRHTMLLALLLGFR